jgi:DUF1009 family protein
MRKSHQSNYVDIPTIGPDTIDQASRAGLKGIAIEANGVQVLNCGDVLQKLSQYGLFLYAF